MTALDIFLLAAAGLTLAVAWAIIALTVSRLRGARASEAALARSVESLEQLSHSMTHRQEAASWDIGDIIGKDFGGGNN
jgi:hypothetical protein